MPVALEAAEAAREEGWDLEVVDVRTIVPFDDATVTASVRRTGRCVVIQEAPGFAGVGAEIAARVQERCFHALHAPVLRVAGLDIPYPAPMLEHTHLPGGGPGARRGGPPAVGRPAGRACGRRHDHRSSGARRSSSCPTWARG